MNNSYTENLADFGFREIKLLNEILTAWIDNGLPEGFCNSGVKSAMNKNSGFVFLVNDEYQVVMFNDDKLELFHNLPDSGHEGFLTELMDEFSPAYLNQDDIDYILEMADQSCIELNEVWKNI